MPIALDTSVVANGNGVNSLAFPALSTLDQNEILIAGFHFSNTTQSGVTFDGSLTWNLLTTSVTIPTAGGEIFLYWARVIQPIKSIVYTATFTGASFPQVSQIIAAYKGVNMANPIGAFNSGTVGSGTSVSAAITTTKANSNVISFTGQTANNAMSAGTGQTEVNETASVGGFSRCNTQYTTAITSASGTSVTCDTSVGVNTSMAIYTIELIDGSRPSFQTKPLRPRIFTAGLAR